MDLPHEFHSTFSGIWKYEFAGTVIFSRTITPEQVHDWRFFGHYSNAQSAKFSYDEKVSEDSGGNGNHRFFFARGGLGPAHPFLPRLLEQERLRPLFEKKAQCDWEHRAGEEKREGSLRVVSRRMFDSEFGNETSRIHAKSCRCSGGIQGNLTACNWQYRNLLNIRRLRRGQNRSDRGKKIIYNCECFGDIGLNFGLSKFFLRQRVQELNILSGI